MNTDTQNNNKLTTVKTVYARIAVILLALNFCLTGYVVINLNNTLQKQIEGADNNNLPVRVTVPSSQTRALDRKTSTEVQSNPVETLNRSASSGPEGQ